MTPRLVGIAVSGAIHATVFASLAFTTPRTPETGPCAAETSLILETPEDGPTPPAPTPPMPAPPITPKSSEARDAHHHPPVRPPAAAAPDLLARFMMAIPATNAPDTTGEGGLGTVADREGTAADPMPETTYGEDEVSTPATLLSNVDATYPTEAWSSGVEADVPVEIVVDARGSVVSARVVTRAGHGFDDAALASIRSYRFAAAQRDGRAVRVRVRWSIQFRLRR
ncbi:MAG: TonB family protein [Labilithrix sp.]